MHMIKQLILITCCSIATAFCSENKPPAIQQLHEKIMNVGSAVKSNTNIPHENNNLVNATLSNEQKNSWPLQAKLITFVLAAFVAWEHKEQLKSHNHPKSQVNTLSAHWLKRC